MGFSAVSKWSILAHNCTSRRTSMLVYFTIRLRYSKTEMPGAAREWNLVRASGVSTTWSLCCINRLSMCEMSTMSVSVEQSMNAQGTVGSDDDDDDVGVDVDVDAGAAAVDDSPSPPPVAPAPMSALAAFTPPPLLEVEGCAMVTWGVVVCQLRVSISKVWKDAGGVPRWNSLSRRVRVESVSGRCSLFVVSALVRRLCRHGLRVASSVLSTM